MQPGPGHLQGWGTHSFSISSLRVLEGCSEVSLGPSFLRLNSLISLNISPQHRCSSPLIILWPSSGPAPTAPCLSVLMAPDLDAVLQMGLHEGRAEGDNPLSAYCHPSVDADRDTTGLLGHTCTLLTQVQLFIHQNLLCRAALKFFSQFVHTSGIALTQLQCTWPC